jgi:hypothetical protein
MPVITGGSVAPDYGVFQHTAAPTAGTNAVQTLTIGGTPNGGTFILGYGGERTSAISWNATAATFVAAIDTALEALPNIGTGGVTVANSTLNAGIGAVTITFDGTLTGKRAVSAISVVSSALTGTSPTVAINSVTTNGVDATYVTAPKGALLMDQNSGKLYCNTGSDGNPTWTVTGSQS